MKMYTTSLEKVGLKSQQVHGATQIGNVSGSMVWINGKDGNQMST